LAINRYIIWILVNYVDLYVRNKVPILLLIAVILAGQSNGEGVLVETSLDTREDSLSYAIGVTLGEHLQQQNLEELNTEIVLSAMRQTLEDNEIISYDESRSFISLYNQDLQKEQLLVALEKERAFLDSVSNREEVVTLPSGLRYQILNEGEGKSPDASDTVTVHYHGTFIGGKVFDSSRERGEPATFAVNQVIKGWTEALQLMEVGAKWKLFIPSNLAYGPRGASTVIPPNSTLIFEVELLSVEKAK